MAMRNPTSRLHCRRALGALPPVRRARTVVLGAVLAIGATLAVPIVSSVGRPKLASAHADSCPDIQVVFARGTGEPPGSGRVGEAFAESLRSLVTGKSVAVYGVNYPASHEFLRAVDGANDASLFVQGMAVSCPRSRMVLGGYSQGAAVIDIITVAGQPIFGFADPLPDGIAEHVAAVAIFGNPSNKIAGPLTALSPLYGYKTIDLCNGADPVCSGGNDVPAHSLYAESGLTTQAAQFVVDRLTNEQTTELTVVSTENCSSASGSLCSD